MEIKTFTLEEAAAFLKLHPEEVRRRAKCGALPGAKTGKRWELLDADLAEYVRSLYAQPRQALRVASRKEIEACHSTNAAVRGGSMSPHPPASALDALLALPTALGRKNSTTN